jgi:hypothetical protein
MSSRRKKEEEENPFVTVLILIVLVLGVAFLNQHHIYARIYKQGGSLPPIKDSEGNVYPNCVPQRLISSPNNKSINWAEEYEKKIMRECIGNSYSEAKFPEIAPAPLAALQWLEKEENRGRDCQLRRENIWDHPELNVFQKASYAWTEDFYCPTQFEGKEIKTSY